MNQLHRDDIVAQAELWLRTPWRHMARIHGAGVDCGQLIIAAYEGAGIVEDVRPGHYSADWMMHQSGERFLGWVREYLDDVNTPGRGDVAVWKFGRCYSHGAIVTAWPKIIHAYRPEGGVVLGDASKGRLAGRSVLFFTADGRIQ